MRYYAVIDTNVFLSALLSKKEDSATVRVLEEVLHRPRFHLEEDVIQKLLRTVIRYGIEVFPQPTGEILIDMDDLIFYEVAMEKREDDAYLVTGNQKHYPIRDYIVTPAEMMALIEA